MFHSFQKNVLTSSDCSQLINLANSIGFTPSTVNIHGQLKSVPTIRNNERIEFQNSTLASQLLPYVLDAFPEISSFKNRTFLELNNNFRFYRYFKDQYFKPHKDGHVIDDNKESLLTILFYLNDCSNDSGGQTILMPNGFSHSHSWISISPTKGSVLIFDHDCWHESKPLNFGEKFVLRTDAFFQIS